MEKNRKEEEVFSPYCPTPMRKRSSFENLFNQSEQGEIMVFPLDEKKTVTGIAFLIAGLDVASSEQIWRCYVYIRYTLCQFPIQQCPGAMKRLILLPAIEN